MVKQEPAVEYKTIPQGWNPNRKVITGEKFQQEVIFYSEGQRWPGNVKFAKVFGHDMQHECGTVYLEQPLTVSFTAPEKPGRYFATYRLMTNGEEFGEKMYLNLAVEEPQPAPEPEVKKEPQGSSLLDSAFMPPAAEQSPKIQEEKKEDKPLDKASMMISAIENKDDDLQNSFEVCSPDPQEDKKDDEIIEDMPL